ncbi:hypothetical protein O0L34_g16327 [Tuta absoluta]|nr:hypothetical protein O0L34_g16327 [Tuta absoluta]
MKFLILATCACMAVAAPASNEAYRVGSAALRTAAAPFVITANAAEHGASAAAHEVSRGVHKRSPASSEAEAPVLRNDFDSKPDGSFVAISETGNGIKSESSGELRTVGDAAAVVVRGSYSYTGPEGEPVQVNYVADENGYQPQSASIPVGPEVPAYIARAVEYIAAHPYQEAKKL